LFDCLGLCSLWPVELMWPKLIFISSLVSTYAKILPVQEVYNCTQPANKTWFIKTICY